MKSSLDNEKDSKKIDNAGESSGRSYISIEKGHNFIRLLSKDYAAEFVHVLQVGKKQYSRFNCLGGIDGDGYAPDECPACAEAKKHWDKRKEIMLEPKYEKSSKLKAEAKIEYDYGTDLRAGKEVKMVAVYGSAVLEKDKKTGKKKQVLDEWDSEAKILNITAAQWKKLRKTIFEENDFMEDSDDLINRNLCFVKGDGKGKDGKKITEVKIKPSKKISDPPEVENDLPSLDNVFRELSEKEVRKEIRKYKEFKGDDVDEDDDDEIEEEEIEVTEEDDDIEEEDTKKKKKKSKKDEEEEDEEDIEEEDEDEKPNKKKKSKDDETEDDDDDF